MNHQPDDPGTRADVVILAFQRDQLRKTVTCLGITNVFLLLAVFFATGMWVDTRDALHLCRAGLTQEGSR
jgi:hypothetical protein